MSRKIYTPVLCTKQTETPLAIKWMPFIDLSSFYFLKIVTMARRNVDWFCPQKALLNRPTPDKIHAQNRLVYVTVI